MTFLNYSKKQWECVLWTEKKKFPILSWPHVIPKLPGNCKYSFFWKSSLVKKWLLYPSFRLPSLVILKYEQQFCLLFCYNYLWNGKRKEIFLTVIRVGLGLGICSVICFSRYGWIFMRRSKFLSRKIVMHIYWHSNPKHRL